MNRVGNGNRYLPASEDAVQSPGHAAIERALTQLSLQYTHWVDSGQGSRLASLFTEDGCFDAGGVRMVGQQELRRGFAIREGRRDLLTRHVCTNMLFEIHDDRRASGVIYLTLYRASVPEAAELPVEFSGPAVVGTYHDDYARVGDAWLIRSRQARLAFVSPDDVTWSLDDDPEG
ncbi:nuclear transport factor 2 family protein [Jiangella asiatica]|uniref:Nuclear transport factor 2 family protein n=1 Tax=Jiangella asiatica TaxID=2530372 RepID=A0A4R5DRW7_9ACTN|nr:nuclear transport factor 2 family protein [Jiangella asiatica]TDE14990.1 nuclear transport factor 2 family protein [Jiangella asiatica]